MTPREGTPEYRLWITAIDIAMWAPYKQGKYVTDAHIPWFLIAQLRKDLEALGIDWRTAKERTAKDKDDAIAADRIRRAR